MNNSKFIDNLRELNRKERFYLINYILSDKNNFEFRLSNRFKKAIEAVLSDKNIQIQDKYFAAMDYHFDWIFAALYTTKSNLPGNVYCNNDNQIKGNQEDVDFLLALQQEKQCHLILIEAKAETEWKNKQFLSKINRIKSIFGENGEKWKNVIPYLVLISPYKPKNLKLSQVPNWLLLNNELRHISLELPNLKKVTRCNNIGNKMSNGDFWTLETTRV